MNDHHRTARSAGEISPVTSFFRILRPIIIQEKRLKFPQKFITRFGHKLSNAATISVSDGVCWTIKLERADEKVHLTDGWHEFVQHYSIKDFYFLVFEYKRKSNFEVFIFDVSCSEIRYPSEGPSNVKIPKSEPMDEEDEQPTKSSKKTVFEKIPKIARKREEAIKAAEMLKTKNPSFKAIMKKYNVASAGFVYVPIKFSSKCLCLNGFSGPIKLRSASDGKEWDARYNNYARKGSTVGQGWIAFKNENHLKTGDVCVFELIQGAIVVLQVTIFRAS